MKYIDDKRILNGHYMVHAMLETPILSIGQRLAETREELGYSVDSIAERLRISKRYLSFLEHDEFEKIPALVYREQYLKTYASFLGFRWEEIQPFYEETLRVRCCSKDASKAIEKVTSSQLWVGPRIVKYAGITLVFLACLGYLGVVTYHSLRSPDLVIDAPSDHIASNESTVIVTGKTESAAELTINEQPIAKRQDGTFSQEVSLTGGVNLIRVAAAKKFSRPTVMYRTIIREDNGVSQNINTNTNHSL